MSKPSLHECLEYEKRNSPETCSGGVIEGEIYAFLSYATDPSRFESPLESDIERFGYIENHMPRCGKCRDVYKSTGNPNPITEEIMLIFNSD